MGPRQSPADRNQHTREAQTSLQKLVPGPLCSITPDRIEAWKQRRLRAGRTANTVLRDLFTLSSVLARAVKLGVLPENPIRRGELLKLRWSCVDLSNRVLTVDGPTSKTRRTRHLPLNSEATSVPARWREQSGGTDPQRREAVAKLNERPAVFCAYDAPIMGRPISVDIVSN